MITLKNMQQEVGGKQKVLNSGCDQYKGYICSHHFQVINSHERPSDTGM